jgi:hypothetical protein
MTFEEANKECDRICDFLRECGGVYQGAMPDVERSILLALASGQYVIGVIDGAIQYFVSYWRINPEDISTVVDRIQPIDISTGTVMYVTEIGNKAGKKGMLEIAKKLREKGRGMQGIFWHRPAKEDRVFYFPSQKGVRNG